MDNSTLQICNNYKSFDLNIRCSIIHHVRKRCCDDINFLGKYLGNDVTKGCFQEALLKRQLSINKEHSIYLKTKL